MKKRLVSCLLSLLLLAAPALACFAEQEDAASNFYPDFSVGYPDLSAEHEEAIAWFKAQETPFSFALDGVPSAQFLSDWTPETEESGDADGSWRQTRTWTDPEGTLAIELSAVCYSGLPTVEWVAHVRNLSDQNSAQITDLRVLDVTVPTGTDGTRLITTKGALGQYLGDDNEDYLPEVHEIGPGQKRSFFPAAGRSTNAAWPYFNLRTEEDGGMMLAIGWSGQWLAYFEQSEDRTLRMTGGMQYLDTYLLPGEEIRTPSVSLTFYKGSREDGQNLFRRVMLSCYTPVDPDDPEKLKMPLSINFWGGSHGDYQVQMAREHVLSGVEVDTVWVDAAWYGEHGGGGDSVGSQASAWFGWTGDWQANSDLYPDGFAPVVDAVHENGLRYLLWFEPERTDLSSSFRTEHPDDWFYPGSVQHSTIVNFGNPDALAWWIDYATNFITESNLDIWRQDFNIEPLAFWRRNDEAGRQGISEIRHIEGLYAFWDALRACKPSLIIDDCSSGGRRLDFEALRRSVPLWSSDYYCNSYPQCSPEGSQSHQMSLSQWLPLFGSGFGAGNSLTSSWVFRSNLSTAMSYSHLFPYNKQFKTLVSQAVRTRPLLYGNYYVLTEPDPFDKSVWQAYECFRPDLDEGFLLAFRRLNAEEGTETFCLRGLDPDTVYAVSDADKAWQAPQELTGRELMEEGFSVKLSKENAGLFFITVLDK